MGHLGHMSHFDLIIHLWVGDFCFVNVIVVLSHIGLYGILDFYAIFRFSICNLLHVWLDFMWICFRFCPQLGYKVVGKTQPRRAPNQPFILRHESSVIRLISRS